MEPVKFLSGLTMGHIGLILIAGCTFYLWRLYRQRASFDGLPMPPRSFWFGHLPLLIKLKGNIPKDLHFACMADYVKNTYSLGDAFYLDLWPFEAPLLFISDIDMLNTIMTQKNVPKHPFLQEYLGPVLGPSNMLTQEGPAWKSLRAMFNPGFAAMHLTSLVPMIVDTTILFHDILQKHAAAGEVFSMEDAATRYTIDIIGRVVLDTDFEAQRGENEFVTAFRDQLTRLPKPRRSAPISIPNPVNSYHMKRNEYLMDKFLGSALEQRFSSKSDHSSTKSPKQRSILNLAIDWYLNKNQAASTVGDRMPAEFKQSMISQMKTFVFAGHDTTSTTITYAFYLLSKNPDTYDKMCEEIDAVLSPEFTESCNQLKQNPELLNRLPYTTGVLKESLRLFPPATSVRTGEKGQTITDSEGKVYPIGGMRIIPNNYTIGHDPAIYPSPELFCPERWSPGSPLSPTRKDAWQPFSKGPRNCIGQELAMIEGRIALVLAARYFRLEERYPDPTPDQVKKGEKLEYDGIRCYQVLIGTAHPKQGMPCRLHERGV